VLEILDHSRSHQQWVLTDDRVIEYVRQAGFFHPFSLRWVRLDWPLLTALIDRGKPEHPCFIFDMEDDSYTSGCGVLLGLRIDSPAVTGLDDRDWAMKCERLLGVVPTVTAMNGGSLKLTWFRQQFTQDPLADVQAQQHAHACILHMFGTTMFPDYSTNLLDMVTTTGGL